MFFEEGSLDKNIEQALLKAKTLRKLLRQHDEEKFTKPAPFVFGR